MIRDLFVSAAAFGAAFLWNVSPKLNFTVAFLFGIAGCVVFWLFGKDSSPTASKPETSR